MKPYFFFFYTFDEKCLLQSHVFINKISVNIYTESRHFTEVIGGREMQIKRGKPIQIWRTNRSRARFTSCTGTMEEMHKIKRRAEKQTLGAQHGWRKWREKQKVAVLRMKAAIVYKWSRCPCTNTICQRLVRNRVPLWQRFNPLCLFSVRAQHEVMTCYCTGNRFFVC